VLGEAKTEAERHRRAAQRQVDDLVRQRDSITGHLDQLRSLLGATMPGAALAAQVAHSAQVAAAAAEPDFAEGVPTAQEIAQEADQTIVLPDTEAAAAQRR